ncbi:hypothetical protein RB195_005582 [Necator americanus]|uniref:Uncharacterized protein n=1 Tax=Necator americanus TaxID=51031 RepID=A0ABR1BRZ2_NECAM
MNECPVCGAAKSRMERLRRRAQELPHRESQYTTAPSVETVRSHCEFAEHAHQEHAEDADEFLVETITFQNLQDYQIRVVTEKVDGVTVEHCFNHLGHEARPSQLRLEKSAEQYIVSLLRDGLTVRQVYKKDGRHGPVWLQQGVSTILDQAALMLMVCAAVCVAAQLTIRRHPLPQCVTFIRSAPTDPALQFQ